METNCEHELYEDILRELMRQNEANISQMGSNCVHYHKFKATEGVVQIVLTISGLLDQNDCVKYTTIELLDRFFVRHVCETRQQFLESAPSLAIEWPEVEQKMCRQMHLRVVTCLAIASKLHASEWSAGDGVRVLNSKDVQQFLAKCGHKYSLRDVNKCELRVLTAMNFELSVTTIYSFAETLLSILNYNLGQSLPKAEYFATAKQLTDVYYSCRTTIVGNAFRIIYNGIQFDKRELEFEKIGANKMLISAGIIASIPVIIDVSRAHIVAKELSYITAIDDNDIRSMSYAILWSVCDN